MSRAFPTAAIQEHDPKIVKRLVAFKEKVLLEEKEAAQARQGSEAEPEPDLRRDEVQASQVYAELFEAWRDAHAGLDRVD